VEAVTTYFDDAARLIELEDDLHALLTHADLRQAAFALGIQRVAEACRLRGYV